MSATSRWPDAAHNSRDYDNRPDRDHSLARWVETPAAGFRRIVALVKVENEISIRLFAKAGYRDVGRVAVSIPELNAPVPVVKMIRDIALPQDVRDRL